MGKSRRLRISISNGASVAGSVRRQLSLYVPVDSAAGIEAVRALVDPLQHSLIPAHVTLCREDELGDMDAIRERLAGAGMHALRLAFGAPLRFSTHGVLLPCIAGIEQFRELRQALLQSRAIRELSPHITLAHPRNPPCAGDGLALAGALPGELAITFPVMRLIEQTGNAAWRELERVELAPR
jgi:hypothetical protein